ARKLLQYLELGTESEHTVIEHGVEERLHAQPVSREKQALLATVPERERKHAPKAFETGLAPLLPSMHDYFRVAVRFESVAKPDELLHQFLEVVDLTVEHDGNGPILVEKRLMPAGKIDDRQTLMREG